MGASTTRLGRYGLGTLTFLVIASMVGAGVFTTSGHTLQALGSPGLVLWAWIVSGGIALAGAESYGRLIQAIPESGGEYVFLARAAHPFFGFLAGWISLIAGFTGAIALAATAFESYLAPAASRPGWLPENAVAVGLVLAGGAAHGLRAGAGVRLQNAAVLIKLVFLAAFLAFAASRLGEDVWQGAALPTGEVERGVVGAFATSLVWISLSYSGFNAAVYVAEEAREAARIVPKALRLGTIIVIGLYVLLNAVFVYAPPPERIAGQDDIGTIAGAWLGGERVALLVRAIICLALMTSVLGMVMAAPRVYAKMADQGMLPGFLKFQGDTPRLAVAAQVGLAAFFVLVSDLRGLLGYLGLTLSLCAAAAVGCLLLPGVRRGKIWRVRHLPALVYIGCTVAAGATMAVFEPRQVLATAVTVAAGALVYVIFRPEFRAGEKPRCGGR